MAKERLPSYVPIFHEIKEARLIQRWGGDTWPSFAPDLKIII